MKFNFDSVKTDCVILPIFEESLQGLAIRWCHEGHCKRNEITWIRSEQDRTMKLLLGLGKRKDYKAETLRQAAGILGRALEKEGIEKISVDLSPFSAEQLEEAPAAIAEGWLLGTYRFDQHKQQPRERQVESVSFISATTSEPMKAALHLAIIRAEGTNWCRDMANEPPNHMRPQQVIEAAKQRLPISGISLNIIHGNELEQQQLFGLAAVGKGSDFAPALLELSYCTDEHLPCIALIGKGITFDTGGISLKKSRDMSDMRLDMSGAAAVLGALYVAAQSGKPVNVKVYVPLAENRPGPGSMLPGDVINYANGMNVQVSNTDAEGRLVLADAILRAQREGIKEIIDIATLTGACLVSLGDRIAGVWGDEQLLEDLRQASESSGDKVWPMPLEQEYDDMLRSDYADFANISKGPHSGAITAALFLHKFIEDGVKWAHIDMAGPMEATSTKGYIPAGATGYGVRLLSDLLIKRADRHLLAKEE